VWLRRCGRGVAQEMWLRCGSGGVAEVWLRRCGRGVAQEMWPRCGSGGVAEVSDVCRDRLRKCGRYVRGVS